MKLIYIGDPMCSWCYGITHEWDSLKRLYPEVEVEYLMGGLRPNGTEAMSSLKDFLQEHWEEIYHRTGMSFNYGVLSQDLVYNTEPACRAVVTFRHFNPRKTGDFFKQIQQAFYYQNYNPYSPHNYAGIAERMGVDAASFIAYFLSQTAARETMADMDKARQLGASGFPTIILEIEGTINVITRGFQTAPVMAARMQQLMHK
ncbi:MAG: DsbA family protein [Saprospiraceae bacterium]|nr:DsbA family protein [Saprospiraceae bacterium]